MNDEIKQQFPTSSVIYLCLIVSARKKNVKKIDPFTSDSSSRETDVVTFADGFLDLRGGIKKYFALEAALIDHGRNMICSPLSVLMPLGKMLIGATNQAENELLDAIGLKRKKQLNSAIALVRTNMMYLKGVELDVASKIYVSSEKAIKDRYKKHALSIFGTSIEKIDRFHPKETAAKINDWVIIEELRAVRAEIQVSIREMEVEIARLKTTLYTCSTRIDGLEARVDALERLFTFEVFYFWQFFCYQVADKTRNKITKLFSSSDISRDTSIVLVNAVYFAGKWKHRFHKSHTGDFHSPSGLRRLPMMTREGHYKYWKCDVINAEVIEIPYEGSQASMIIVLPFSNSGLPVLLRALKLSPKLLNKALEKMKFTDVILTMPKFKIESSLDLMPLLKKIGLNSIFDSRASGLSEIIEDEEVFVTAAIHKAIIEVNEKGTEAAAATGIEMVPLSGKLNQQIFHANRAFLFYVVFYKEQLFSGVFSG